MKLLSVLLIIGILGAGFTQPPPMHKKMNDADSCMMKRLAHKPGGCSNNKQNSGNTFCNYCVLCIAFIIPVKPGIQRNFVSALTVYPELVQSELTDFNCSPWRPPNA
jgi:hypothetical protein